MIEAKIRISVPNTPEGDALLAKAMANLALMLKAPPKIQHGDAYNLVYFYLVDEENACTRLYKKEQSVTG